MHFDATNGKIMKKNDNPQNLRESEFADYHFIEIVDYHEAISVHLAYRPCMIENIFEKDRVKFFANAKFLIEQRPQYNIIQATFFANNILKLIPLDVSINTGTDHVGM